MAKYAAEGARVTLVTCTLGEEGEILVPELADLSSSAQDLLGQHRIGELAAACTALGVQDHRFLGGAGRWRDSGMMGTPQNDHPDCFWQADRDVAVEALLDVLREVQPQVVVSYDAKGGYGHPDHVQAHLVTRAAIERSAGEPWAVQKVYETAFPKSVLQAGIDLLKQTGETNFFGADSADDLPFGNPDEDVTTEIDARDHLDAKMAAMRAHATQIEVDGPFFALSNNVGQQAMGVEHYILVGAPVGARESDLFDGVA